MTYQEQWRRLTPLYEPGEAQAIVRTVLDVQFGLSLTDIYSGKVTELSANDVHALDKIMQRLEKGEPVQYVLGQTSFCQYIYKVCGGVLIPRPETEELVQWIADEHGGNAAMPSLRVLDIGTGSGCIAITLALKLAQAQVEAWDVSDDALTVAQANARRLGAEVLFEHRDILAPPSVAPRYDLIVSNPPYICEKEKSEMERNVLDYEPALALFVPDEDPLRFYRAIAAFSVQALKDGGSLYLEINPLYAEPLCEMLATLSFAQIESRQDAFGKVRFVKAEKLAGLYPV